ncbi:MAG: glycosyl transferase [Alphaproteobacteria bacterium]|nr:glycosyl transferase [Alphaproteobacteria bacterium]
MTTRYKREAWIARISLFTTLVLFGFVGEYLVKEMMVAVEEGNTRLILEVAGFALCVLIILYSNMLYHICLIGHYIRKSLHIPASRDAIESLYDREAPELTVLIPSYKEEPRVVMQTMLSAALSEYPAKNVVLLVDDPQNPKTHEDIQLLSAARNTPHELQAMFDGNAARFNAEREAFAARRAAGAVDVAAELHKLAKHYDEVADWLQGMARDFCGETAVEDLHFAEKFFVEAILLDPAKKHAARAQSFRAQAEGEVVFSELMLARHYNRLAGIFTVAFSSFERKKYVNLSHEANKAMNLNCYMALIGKSWKEVQTEQGLELHECMPVDATFSIQHADYIDTIDADSLMLSDYVLRLIYMMEQPKNARIAVAQSPCSAYPGCENPIERIAGACIDVQFHTHQGYTHWDASYWVGANAMLRRAALEEIKEVKMAEGKRVTIYIQDRTVIEDTESTIDLVAKGWKLYNYPERMTFSSTPPDFGSLLIQRRRWSNGGLIILPKLLGYAWKQKKDLRLAKEMFLRVNYLALTTAGCIVSLMFYFYPFSRQLITPAIVVSSIPLLLLYSRDLKISGYKYSDSLRVCALNLMLFPIIVGGVFKQFQQMLTGKKIPFGRTPKIPGRTAAPALYSALEVLLTVNFLGLAMYYAYVGNWSKFGFTAVNAAFFTYALVNFIGVRAAFEDIFAGMRTTYRTVATASLPAYRAAVRFLLPAPKVKAGD